MKYWYRIGLRGAFVVLGLLTVGRRSSMYFWAANGGGNPKVFTDFHGEHPGNVHKIMVADLPAPFTTESVDAGSTVVSRPSNAWPQAPAGFKVQLFAEKLDNPRLARTAPNGDVFVAESEPGRIKVYRGMGADGRAASMYVFVSGLTLPFGIAF